MPQKFCPLKAGFSADFGKVVPRGRRRPRIRAEFAPAGAPERGNPAFPRARRRETAEARRFGDRGLRWGPRRGTTEGGGREPPRPSTETDAAENSACRRPGFPPDLGRILPRGPPRSRNSRRPGPRGGGRPRSPRGPAPRSGRGDACRFPGTPAGFPGAERPNGAKRELPRPHIETDAAETLPTGSMVFLPDLGRVVPRGPRRPRVPAGRPPPGGARRRCEGRAPRLLRLPPFRPARHPRRCRKAGRPPAGRTGLRNRDGTGGASGFAPRPVTAAGAREGVGGRMRENRRW